MPVYKDKERGTWYYNFRKVINGETYCRRCRGFATKAKATAAEAEAIKALLNHKTENIIKSKEMTLDDIYLEYYNYRKTKVKITTLDGNNRKYQVHIKETFGNLKIDSIDNNSIAKWRTNLINKSFTERFTNQVISTFKDILNYAIRKGYIVNTKLVDELEPASMHQMINEREVWTLEEIKKFLDSFDLTIDIEKMYHDYFYAYSQSGMRPNEFRALKVADIQGNYLNVNKDITSKIKGSKYIIQTPKNKQSIRKVLMNEEVIKVLRDITKGYKPNDFIFGKDEPMSEKKLITALKRHAVLAELKPIVLYGFRHSHATNLIRAGVPIKVVSRRLGHKDASTTMNVYWHLFQEDEELVLNVIK